MLSRSDFITPAERYAPLMAATPDGAGRSPAISGAATPGGGKASVWASPVITSGLVVNRGSSVEHRHCAGFDAAGLVAATRVSFPLIFGSMEFSLSPHSSVYS